MAYALDATIYRQRLLQRCSHELGAVLVVLPVATACSRGVMESGWFSHDSMQRLIMALHSGLRAGGPQAIESALAIAKHQ